MLKQFVGTLPANCLNVFDYFVGLARKGLKDLFPVLISVLHVKKITFDFKGIPRYI